MLGNRLAEPTRFMNDCTMRARWAPAVAAALPLVTRPTPARRIDFPMTGKLLHSFDDVKNQVPTLVVAAIGWLNCLCGKRQAANAMMLKDNPEMSVVEMEASVGLMKAQGSVDSGEAASLGHRRDERITPPGFPRTDGHGRPLQARRSRSGPGGHVAVRQRGRGPGPRSQAGRQVALPATATRFPAD